MSNPITVSHLGTLIIDDKNLPLQSDFNLLINQFDQFNNLILNDSGNFVTWTAPTTILSITSLSSLPGSFIFVRNISTKQRITLDGNLSLHSSNVSKMISYIYIIVNGIRYNLDLTTSGIVINPVNRTIDFNYIATDLSDHVIKMKLRSASTIDIGTEINIEYTISVLASNIFQFPTIDNTTKNSPHDILDVTVGQTLSMTSTFSNNIHSDIVSTVIINDGFSNINAVSSISDNNINYSFTIINDSDHSGIITLSFGDVDNNYSWSANGLLTAINDIYTFPNYVSYDASINNYDTGIDLKSELSNTLILHFTGGDHLYSDIYFSQVSSITYKTGNNGNIITVNSSDVVINSATDYETITVNNIVPTEVEDVYIYITLKGPDGAIMISPLTITISNSKIESGVLIISWNANHVSSGYSYANASDKEITTTINLNDTIKINSSVNVWPSNYDGKGYSALPSQFLEDDFEVVIANYNMGFQYANLYVTNDPNATITDFDSQYPNTSSHSSLTIQHQMKHGGSFQFANGGTLPFNSDIFGASGAKYRVLAGQTDNPNSAWGGRVYFSGTNNPRRNVFIKYKREGNNFSAVWSQNGVTGPWITDRSGIPELGFDNGYSSIMQIPDGYNKLLVGFSNSQNSGTSSAWPKYNIILDYNKIISIEQNKENALNMIGTSSTIETINAKYFRIRIINPVNTYYHSSWFQRLGIYTNYTNAKIDTGNFTNNNGQFGGINDPFSENQDLIRWRYKTSSSNISYTGVHPNIIISTNNMINTNPPYTSNLIGSNPSPTWPGNQSWNKVSISGYNTEFVMDIHFDSSQNIEVVKFGNMQTHHDSHTQIEFYTSPDNSNWTQVYCYYYPDPTNTTNKIYTHQGAIEHNPGKGISYPTPANLKMANLLNPASESTTMPQTNDPVYGFLTTTPPPPPPGYWIGIYGENSLSASYQYHTELEIEFSDSTFIGNSTHGSYRSTLKILDNTKYTTTYDNSQSNVMNLFDGNFGTPYTPTNIPVGNNSMLFSLKIDRDPSTIVGGRLCVQSSPYRFSSYKIYRTTLDPSLHSNVQDVNNGDWVLAAPLTLSSNYTGW